MDNHDKCSPCQCAMVNPQVLYIGGVTATLTDIHGLGGRGEGGVGPGLATPHCN